MASIGNTRKVFQFAVDVNGIEQLSVQKISGLGIELETVAHGEGDSDVHTPGRIKYGDGNGKVTMTRVKPATVGDNFLWQQIQNARIAIGAGYKNTLTVRHLGPDGITTIGTWVLTGAFVSKVSLNEMNRVGSDNVEETVEWTVDRIDVL